MRWWLWLFAVVFVALAGAAEAAAVFAVRGGGLR